MRVSQLSICSLIVMSCLIVGTNRQLVTDACAKSSEYSTSMILAQAPAKRKSLAQKNAPKDPLYGSYTEDEIDLLAVICYREARGEGIEGMRLVADVILNRVDSDNFPNTIKEVIAEPGQFSTYDEDDMTEDLTIDCYGAVLAELDQRTDPDILYFTAGGYNACGDPAYRVGNHYFSR